jgi:hypothetical protein
MSDPLNDPRFPDRPTHPDFWRMSEIILQQDGDATEGGQSVEEIVKETVDMQSLSYFAMQRAGKQLQNAGLPEALMPVVAATWMDAFLAGATFQKRGGHQ